MMQLIRTTNALLSAHPNTRHLPSLRARHYSVLPLGAHSGLIQWVGGVTPLYSVYQARVAQQRTRGQPMAQGRGVAERGIPAGGGGRAQAASGARAPPHPTAQPPTAPPPAPPPRAAAAPRPAETFFRCLTPKLEALGIPANAPRRAWPPPVLKAVLLDLAAETPRDLISAELFAAARDARGWWDSTQAFARSNSVMAVLGFVVGLGDRHLDNLLLDCGTGQLVHIDFSVCFDKGAGLKVKGGGWGRRSIHRTGGGTKQS